MTINHRLVMKPALALLLLTLGTASAEAQGVKWRRDFESARRESIEKNRPLVVVFGTKDCVWCRKMEATTYRDSRIARLLNEEFVALSLDGEDDRNSSLVDALGVAGFPAVVVLTAEGKVVDSFNGYRGAGQFLRELQDTKQKTRKQNP